MLVNLHVKNLALIEEADIDFEDGLNILTGETGAGKSIILGSINLALGAKVPAGIIRKGAGYALTELVFHITDANKLRALAQLALEELSEGEVIISRKITPGRSQIKVNGMNCTVGQVRAIAAILIDIHGQHDNQTLLHESRHLEMVDLFGGAETASARAQYQAVYQEYIRIQEQLSQMDTDLETRQREISFLEYEIHEITAAELRAGEDLELESQYRRMSNQQKIMEEVSTADQLISSGADNARDLLGAALKSVLAALSYDSALQDVSDTLSDAEQLLSDAGRKISAYAQENDSYEEMDFDRIAQRLDHINALKMKYGKTIEAVIAYRDQQQEKLEALMDFDRILQERRDAAAILQEKLGQAAAKLTVLRKNAAQRLCAQIAQALTELNFMNAQFTAEFEETARYMANGRDAMRFLISTNIGEPVKPLSKIASGGELSRIMLAVKTVIADQDELETLIFDEIDAGISGRTAQRVAEKLSRLAGARQILCITHLPQIAAMADTHYLIEKSAETDTTKTDIVRLSEEESISELARLLGGTTITDTVISNAREMKQMADQFKNSRHLQ